MKFAIIAVAMAAGLLAAALAMGNPSGGSRVFAQGHELPGMCNGRSDASVLLVAHANGKAGGAPKYILNLSTDATGHPTGTLVLGRGKERLRVDDWCRLWQHLPGQPYPDQCAADIPEGATTAHAAGIATYGGQQVLVRTDVRGTEEGQFFRVRYRALGDHDHEAELAEHEDGGCDDETWTRIPAHGWAQLDHLKVKAIEP